MILAPSALAAGICLAGPGVGTAGPDAGDPAFLLVLLDMPSAETRGEIDDAIRSQTADLDLRIGFLDYAGKTSGGFSMGVAKTLAAEHEADFVFLISRGGGASLTLHVFDAARGTMLVEEVSAQEEGLVVQAETVAIRVRSCLLLLAEGAHVGLEPAAPPEAPAGPEAEKPKKAVPRVLEITIGYSLATLAPEKKVLHGMTAGLGASPALLRGVVLEFSYTMSPDFSAHDDLVYMHVAHHPFLVGVRYTLSQKRWRVLPGLAVLLEHIERKTVTVDEDMSVKGGTDGINAALVPSARFCFNLLGGLDLFVQVGMDIYLRRIGYGYRMGGEDINLINPWYVRFNVLIGLAADLFQGGR
jgi:hypothetical protein